MLVPGSANPMMLAATAQYQISRSLRFRASATAYLSRTQTAGSQTTWTFSAWVKRGKLTTLQYAVQAGGSSGSGLNFGPTTTDDAIQIEVGNGTTQYYARTTAQYRDPSAWYHIVAVCNTTSATSTLTGTTSDRLQIWINGVQVSSFSASSIPTQNFAGSMNQNTVAANIGRWNGATPNYYWDGYMTEINFIDGQALTASSFGNNNAVTGVWQPKKYTGTYGTNGYYLNFSDNSAATAAAIGKDSSGNGNNWTPNNISVTTGVTYDSMIDTPTPYLDGSTYYNRGNYGVINPNQSGGMVMSAGNILATAPGASWSTAFGTMAIPSGTYWEYTISVVGSLGQHQPGVVTTGATLSNYAGFDAKGWAISTAAGTIYKGYNNNSATAAISGVPTTGMAIGDVWMFAIKNNKLFWGLNGTWYPTGANPATETSPIYSGLPNDVFAAASSYGSTAAYFNFGQQPFKYTPPSGFKALNTYNLATPAVFNGAKYIAATLYTGNGSTQTITNTANGAYFQPDLVWVKGRSSASQDHTLVDSVRGVSRYLRSNTTAADTLQSGFNVTAFNSGGFSVTDDTNGSYNVNGAVGGTFSGAAAYVGWQWQAGAGTTSSNTSGTITSTTSVGAVQGFSIVAYTGTGASATVGHGLGVAPSMIIVKKRSAAGGDWKVYHTSLGAGGALNLDLVNAYAADTTVWNNTSPTSSVFSIGTNTDLNASTITYVAYCFAAVAGYSAFGSYTGNANASGPFIYTGFIPKWVLIKASSTTSAWLVIDTSRQTYNVQGPYLTPNTSDAETTGTTVLDVVSNGFKMRSATTLNASATTYVYAAFAENPFNYSLAR